MVTSITCPFRTTFASLLAGKMYAFRRRSLWRYLLGAVLLSLGWPTLVSSFWLTLPTLAAGLVGLGLAVVLLSSYLQRYQLLFEADVTFRAADIVVQPASGGPAETHDWRWVLQASESSSCFFLVVRLFPRLVLVLDKQALTADEQTLLRQWLATRRAR